MRLKIIIASLALAILFADKGFSQEDQDGSMMPGFKLGLNMASLKGDSIEGTGVKGVALGLSFIALLHERFNLVTEMTLEQKGMVGVKAKEFDPLSTTGSGYKDATVNIRINSAQWGLLGNYYFKYPNLSAQAGAYLGFNFLSMIDVGNEIMPGNVTATQLQDKINEDMVYGLLFGVSGGTEALRIGLRYDMGLNNLYPKDETTTMKLKSNVIQLSLTIYILNARVVR